MSLAYRYYDAETLDRQYNARATVADISPFLRSYREQTAAARATLACHLGLRYGDAPPERLDVFPAAPADRPSPVFVYLHGGYWRLLDAADSAFMAPASRRPASASWPSITRSPRPSVLTKSSGSAVRLSPGFSATSAITAGIARACTLAAALPGRIWPPC